MNSKWNMGSRAVNRGGAIGASTPPRAEKSLLYLRERVKWMLRMQEKWTSKI